MIVRTWSNTKSDILKENHVLPLHGLRYDAGSWIAEILDNELMSYDVVKRRKISEKVWEEWLVPQTVPRLPRESFGVEEFMYELKDGVIRMKEWALSQVHQLPLPPLPQQPSRQQPQQPQQSQQQRQAPLQLQRGRQQQQHSLQHPLQSRPLKQTQETSQQHPTQDHEGSFQQQGRRINNLPNPPQQLPSNSGAHSQPQQGGQRTQGLHSSQHKSVRPPPLPQQPVTLNQPLTQLEPSGAPVLQYHTQAVSSQPQRDSLDYSPQQKAQRQGTSGRGRSGSFQRGNGMRVPVTCQILD